jgi:iron complex transport system ATP-binding protein
MVKLTLQGLGARLAGREVLGGVNADLSGGKLVGVLGPNGAGKTILLRTILHLTPPSAGRVLLNGHNVGAMSSAERARAFAYLPQSAVVHWPLTVRRTVELGRMPHLGRFARPGARDAAAVDAALDATGVLELQGRPVTELSGGERARVMLARALAVEAQVLAADEPLAAFDPVHRSETMARLSALARSGRLVLAVLHDLAVAADWCDHVLLIKAGRVAAQGAPEEVLTRERLDETFGTPRLRVAG